jgi:ATP-grasp domain
MPLHVGVVVDGFVLGGAAVVERAVKPAHVVPPLNVVEHGCWTATGGALKADVAALEDLLLRVSALVEAHPEIAELDCNPVKALPDGVVVVDARIRVEAASLPLPLAGRRR